MTRNLRGFAGNLRSLLAASIILSFIALVGLLVAIGRASQLYLAVVYLLIAVFALNRLQPVNRNEPGEFNPDAGFRPDMGRDDDAEGCACCGTDAPADEDTNTIHHYSEGRQ